ncbi:GNAT family N-acetyltransferase [Brachybacterium sp. YJGR34]|uniref:GNAT family N-acetyltransferase n=1 Tax=Brachybacterium sp. YJGR34 TaxID=2059911 RepID=UPI000E0ACEF8|nr:GNAT family N-acetyltransferase [Brachybacterium sp. YJGR34]
MSVETGQITVAPLDPPQHTGAVHAWLTHPRAWAWQMQEHSPEQVRRHLAGVAADHEQDGWILSVDGRDAAYVETYRPASQLPAEVFAERPGDLGMHLLVAPPDGAGERGFTDRIMGATMRLCFERLGAARVVVEPDVRNAPVLAKNTAAGFRVLDEVELTQEGLLKRAALSLCTPEDFARSAIGRRARGRYEHLTPELVAASHRHLVTKAIAEFSHERMLHPQPLGAGRWLLEVPGAPVRYTFRARVLPLEHWAIEEDSVQRWQEEERTELDALEFVLEMQDALGLPEALVSTYLEELSSTLAAGAEKLRGALAGDRPGTPALVHAGFQQIEAAMTEGHPGFLAANGRIGWSLDDYRAFAPELGPRVHLEWVAVRREHSHLALGEGLDEEAHLLAALGPEELERLAGILRRRGLDPEGYHLLPVHPWQESHRLAISFAADIGRGDLVPLGPGRAALQPQQSLRTFFEHGRDGAPYVKTALAIQNMGFLRGLSPEYMRDTPAINDWVADLVAQDPVFAAHGFSVLRERAALGYTGDAYHRTASSNPHRKMLAALWRENPVPLVGQDEQLMTMAALLHRDHEGRALASALVAASGIGARTWLRDVLSAYLVPLVHALQAHEVVAMPHGENLVLRLRGHRVVGAFLKDVGEEVAVLGEGPLPARLQRIRAEVPESEKALSILTDVFDGVLRHLCAILDVDGLLPAAAFWDQVAAVLDEYEGEHPALRRGTSGGVDLRAPTFAHSCLNRLQLRNTLQMVDLGDQASSLLYSGRIANPAARRR